MRRQVSGVWCSRERCMERVRGTASWPIFYTKKSLQVDNGPRKRDNETVKKQRVQVTTTVTTVKSNSC